MITKHAVRKALVNAGVSLLDARVAWWRSSQYGFVIRQQNDTAAKYIVVESRYPANESNTYITGALDALQSAGIQTGYSNGLIYIHPLQIDEAQDENQQRII